MDPNDEKTLEPVPRERSRRERTPAELLRFRLRIARGYYDRPEVAEAVARRLLGTGALDPPPCSGRRGARA